MYTRTAVATLRSLSASEGTITVSSAVIRREEDMADKTIYHVFADNEDHYKDDEAEARSIYDEMVADGKNCRLYKVDFDDEKGEEAEAEDCLESHGTFPR